MWSYPNYIPLDERDVRGIVEAVRPYTFDRIYGGWWHTIVDRDAKAGSRAVCGAVYPPHQRLNMAAPSEPQRLIAIVGPTATGKTTLAVRLAERIGSEIINADSRQVYRSMDIGTAKPSPADRERIRTLAARRRGPGRAVQPGSIPRPRKRSASRLLVAGRAASAGRRHRAVRLGADRRLASSSHRAGPQATRRA